MSTASTGAAGSGSAAEDGDDPLDVLMAARQGTGVTFPAAVAAYVRRRPAEAVDQAHGWWQRADATTRLVGLEVLAAVVGAPVDPAARERAATLLRPVAAAAARDRDADVRWAAAKALGSSTVGGALRGTDAVATLAVLARDDDPDVRWQAISSLPLAAGSTDPDTLARAVAALTAATADADDDVADQAVFALGLQLEVDTPAVRDALAAHLTAAASGRGDTAAQAALALAQRGDPRAAAAVQAALEQAMAGGPDAVAELEEDWVEAARLVPSLAWHPLLAAED